MRRVRHVPHSLHLTALVVAANSACCLRGSLAARPESSNQDERAEAEMADGSEELLSKSGGTKTFEAVLRASSRRFEKFLGGDSAELGSDDSDDGAESVISHHLAPHVHTSASPSAFRFPYDACLGPDNSADGMNAGCESSDVYHLGDFLGEGTYGKVYKGRTPDGKKVAVKKEAIGGKAQLRGEYEMGQRVQGLPGIARYYDAWSDQSNNYVSTELLGKTVKTLSTERGGKVPIEETLGIGKDMLGVLEGVHGRGLLHQDMKPQNIVYDLGGSNLYLIDFGLSQRWKDEDGVPREFVPKQSYRIRGTPRYSAIRSHYGTVSPTDELESLGYVLLFLAKGNLPWQKSVTESKQEMYKRILAKKQSVTTSDLVAGLPDSAREAFAKYFDAVRGRPYKDGMNPDYKKLISYFEKALGEVRAQGVEPLSSIDDESGLDMSGS